MTEDEMVGWHHQLNGHEFEQRPGDGEGQGSLGCFSPWDHQESDMTEQQFDQERYINMRFSNLVQKKNKERGPKRC